MGGGRCVKWSPCAHLVAFAAGLPLPPLCYGGLVPLRCSPVCDIVPYFFGYSWLQTGASLKLTILNPKGRIWTMVAGGGASVIYADTVSALVMPCIDPLCSVPAACCCRLHYSRSCCCAWSILPAAEHQLVASDAMGPLLSAAFALMWCQVGDLGFAHELGNYAEYSGALNEEETLNYARTLLDVSTGFGLLTAPG